MSVLCNGICVVCRPIAKSSVYFYLNNTPQLPSKTIHTKTYLLWKITAHLKTACRPVLICNCCNVEEIVQELQLQGVIPALIMHYTPNQQIHINTGLQAIAHRATCHKTITICSIYLSPSIACNIAELEDLIRQLPPPLMLLAIFT